MFAEAIIVAMKRQSKTKLQLQQNHQTYKKKYLKKGVWESYVDIFKIQ